MLYRILLSIIMLLFGAQPSAPVDVAASFQAINEEMAAQDIFEIKEYFNSTESPELISQVQPKKKLSLVKDQLYYDSDYYFLDDRAYFKREDGKYEYFQDYYLDPSAFSLPVDQADLFQAKEKDGKVIFTTKEPISSKVMSDAQWIIDNKHPKKVHVEFITKDNRLIKATMKATQSEEKDERIWKFGKYNDLPSFDLPVDPEDAIERKVEP